MAFQALDKMSGEGLDGCDPCEDMGSFGGETININGSNIFEGQPNPQVSITKTIDQDEGGCAKSPAKQESYDVTINGELICGGPTSKQLKAESIIDALC